MKVVLLFLFFLQTSISFGQDTLGYSKNQIFSTNDYMYKDSFFKDYIKVDSFPKYPGGIDSLQKYFNVSVQFEGEETTLFCRYHIIFMVDCHGKLSTFELKSNPVPGYKKILEACEKMAQWIPATINGNVVNCMYRLGFTNRSGKLKVDYREK